MTAQVGRLARLSPPPVEPPNRRRQALGRSFERVFAEVATFSFPGPRASVRYRVATRPRDRHPGCSGARYVACEATTQGRLMAQPYDVNRCGLARARDAMGKLDRALLDRLAKGPSELPPHLGTMTLSRLLHRGLAAKHPYAGHGPRLYAITEKGRAVLATLGDLPG